MADFEEGIRGFAMQSSLGERGCDGAVCFGGCCGAGYDWGFGGGVLLWRSVAFVGGSLVASGGHNPLEAAQFGVPVVMGPSYENFREIVEDAGRGCDSHCCWMRRSGSELGADACRARRQGDGRAGTAGV